MVHTIAVHHDLGKEIPLEGCCVAGGTARDLNPIDLMAMGLGSCLIIMMAEAAQTKGIDLTGTWADTSYDLKDFRVGNLTVTIHSPYSPATGDEKRFLEEQSRQCPVYLVVKDGTDVRVAFDWGSSARPS
jgi:uncharacterized OsmC-like protein